MQIVLQEIAVIIIGKPQSLTFVSGISHYTGYSVIVDKEAR